MSGWLNLDTGRLGSGGSGGGPLDLNVTPEKSAFEFMQLSWQQRIYGSVASDLARVDTRRILLQSLTIYVLETAFSPACTGGGLVISIVAAILLFIGATIPFAFLYAVGTLLSLAGTGFLCGFLKQAKMMFSPVRLVASIIFLGSIALVFVGAFVLGNAVLCIIFVVISYVAFLWYSLSYVPYARSLVKNMVSKVLG